MDQADLDLMCKLADMSEEETENVLKAIEQSVSKDAPRLTRSGAERVLSEIRRVAQKTRDRKTRGTARRRRRRRQSMG